MSFKNETFFKDILINENFSLRVHLKISKDLLSRSIISSSMDE